MKKSQGTESENHLVSELSMKQIQLIQELYQGGGRGDQLKRRMRPGVMTIMTELGGKDFAENNYWAICQLIINSALVLYFPDQCGHLLAKDQIERIKVRYPLQMQMVKSVIDNTD